MSVPSSPIDVSPTSPTAKKSPVISSGRGGSGNIRATSKLKQDDGINEIEILQKRRAEAALNPRVKVKYTGRGGTGNIRAASSAQSIPFDASADPDDDYEQIVLQGAQLAKRDKTPSTGRGGLGNSARPRSKSFGPSNVGLKGKKDKSRRRRSFASLRFTATSFSSSTEQTYHVSSEISRISSESALSIPSSLSPTASTSSIGLNPPRISFRSSVRSTPPIHTITPSSPLAARSRSASHPTLVLPPTPISPRLSAPNLTTAIKSPTDLQRRIAECRKTLAEPYINMPPFDDDPDLYNTLFLPQTPHPLTPPPPTPVSPPHKLQKAQARLGPAPAPVPAPVLVPVAADTTPTPSPTRWWKRGKRRTAKASTPTATPTPTPSPPIDRNNPSPHSNSNSNSNLSPSPSPSSNNPDTPAPRSSIDAIVDQVAVDAEAAEARMREVMGHLEEVGKRAMEVRMRMRGEGIRGVGVAGGGGVYVREDDSESYVKEKEGRQMVYRQPRYVQQQQQQQQPLAQSPRYGPGYVQKRQQPQHQQRYGGYGYGYGYGGRVYPHPHPHQHPHPHPHPHPHGPLVDPGRETESEYETEESESLTAVATTYDADEDDEDEVEADVYGVNETIRVHHHHGVPLRTVGVGATGVAASSMWALHAVEEEDVVVDVVGGHDSDFVSFLEF